MPPEWECRLSSSSFGSYKTIRMLSVKNTAVCTNPFHLIETFTVLLGIDNKSTKFVREEADVLLIIQKNNLRKKGLKYVKAVGGISVDLR